MMDTILPMAIVLASVWPTEDSPAMLYIISVLALVHPAVGPCEFSKAVHAAILPTALVCTLIRPLKNTLAFQQAVYKFACIRGATRPTEMTKTMPEASPVLALVECPIWPSLLTFAVSGTFRSVACWHFSVAVAEAEAALYRSLLRSRRNNCIQCGKPCKAELAELSGRIIATTFKAELPGQPT